MAYSAEWIGRYPAIARVRLSDLHASAMRGRRVPRGRLGEHRDEGHHTLTMRQ